MQLRGSIRDARNSYALGGTNAAAVYTREVEKVKTMQAAPWPVATGPRPPDEMLVSDHEQYLRLCVTNADWEGVQRWYFYTLDAQLQKTTSAKDFWAISLINVQNYTDRVLTLSDLRAFTELCILKLCVCDLGSKVGFGYGAASPNALNLAMLFLNGLSHNSGQLDWFKSFDAARGGYKYGFCLGWVKEPPKHTTSRIMVAVGAAFMGAAAFNAIRAAYGVATLAPGQIAAAAPVATGGAAIGSGAALPIGIETVTVVGAAPILTAGSVAAGITAGAIVGAAAPPISVPQQLPPSEVIETVTVQGAAPATISAGTVSAGLAAGVVTTVASAPPISITPESEVIETVQVEGARPELQITPTETGVALVTGGVVSTLTQPTVQVEGDSLSDRVKDALHDQVEQYGSDWVQQHLEELLTDLLGAPPTPAQLGEGENVVGGGLVGFAKKYWWVLLLVGVAVGGSAGFGKRRKH